MVAARGDGRVLLAGHLDTVPAQDNLPGRGRRTERVHGLGASDMKGALAVMVELALARRARLSTALVFFGREELPRGDSALTPLLERERGCAPPSSCVMMEPTDNDAARRLPGQHQRDLDLPRARRALRAAVAGRQRDPPRRPRASPRWPSSSASSTSSTA